jgi:hypothetical protein
MTLEAEMAKKSGLEKAAVKLGATLGKAERTARKVGRVAQESQKDLREKMNILGRELKKGKKRLARAVAKVRS